jgi:DNA polymerase
MTNVFIDFETYCETDLRKTSTKCYTSCESFDLLCMAWAVGDKPAELWLPEDPLPGFFYEPENYKFHAYNASFELAVLNNHCAPVHGWPEIPISQWECTAVRAAACGLPRALKHCGAALNLTQQKDDIGHRAMLHVCKPNKDGVRNFNPDLLEKTYAYCQIDVEVEREIHKATPAIPESEQTIWQLDYVINNRGIPVDLESCRHAVNLLEKHKQKLEQEIAELSSGEITTGRQVQRILGWLEIHHGVQLEDLSRPVVETALKDPDLPSEASRMLELRLELSRASVSKYQAMLDREYCGRVHNSMMFYGAGTGRWSGRGVQFQNLTRGSLKNQQQIEDVIELLPEEDPDLIEMLYGDTTAALSSCIRSMVKAPENKQLIACDYTSIEGVVVCALSQHTEMLKLFDSGADIYCEFGAKLYEKPADEITKAERFVSKVAVLSLQYSCGFLKFAEMLHAWGDNQDLEIPGTKVIRGKTAQLDKWNRVAELTGGEKSFTALQKHGTTLIAKPGKLTDHQIAAAYVVDVYRRANRPIVEFWYAMGDAAFACVQTGEPQHVNQFIKFDIYEQAGYQWLRMALPSGRSLYYFKPEIKKQVETPIGKRDVLTCFNPNDRSAKRLYPGLLVENATQAIARDILAQGLLNLERAGINTIFHVHDEACCETDLNVSVEQVQQLLCELPAWAQGWPIKAAGFTATRYRKD